MKRFNIIYKRPNITSNEAKVVADFDQLMIKHQSGVANNSNSWRITGSIAVFIALVGVLFYVTNRDSLKSENSDSISSTETAPVIEDSQKMVQSPVVTEKQDYTDPKATESEKTVSKPDTQKSLAPEPSAITQETSGFQEAYPVDGFPALYQYFDEHLVYPTKILDEGVEGNVIVKFVIDIHGLPGKIVIEKSLHEKLDSTAIALIQQMPRWHPASLDGQAIPSTHRIPLFFQINQTVK